jgi:hypothetical protein
MHGAIPPLSNMPSWCGAQLKHRDNFLPLPDLIRFHIQVMAFWIVMPGSDVVGYLHFRGPCCKQRQNFFPLKKHALKVT